MNTEETKMPLVNDLRERAASYRLGGPSSEHTAKMLEDAADEIDRLTNALVLAAGHLHWAGTAEPGAASKPGKALILEWEHEARTALAKAITAPTEEKAL